MRLGPSEEARLLVFTAAELARRQRAAGVPLNAPEAIAIASDEMHMAARRGGTFDEVLAAGMRSVRPDELLDGVAALIAEIRIEVLLEEGTRLVVLRGLGQAEHEPGAEPGPGPGPGPGEVVVAEDPVTINDGSPSFELEVTNGSDHAVRVSSHFPFDRVNPGLSFDREAARGTRLDVPAGDTVRWGPGEAKVVRLIRVAVDDEARA